MYIVAIAIIVIVVIAVAILVLRNKRHKHRFIYDDSTVDIIDDWYGNYHITYKCQCGETKHEDKVAFI